MIGVKAKSDKPFSLSETQANDDQSVRSEEDEVLLYLLRASIEVQDCLGYAQDAIDANGWATPEYLDWLAYALEIEEDAREVERDYHIGITDSYVAANSYHITGITGC